MTIAIGIIAALILVRALLWAKFRETRQGKRLLASTLQLLVAIATVIAYEAMGGDHAVILISVAVMLIALLYWSIPVREKASGKGCYRQ